MEMKSPQEWGARINYDSWRDRYYKKDDIAIHWGGTHAPTWNDGPEAEEAILRSWERYHIDTKGWRGIAYGYAIGASGTVYRLRGLNNYGAHQGDIDNDGYSNNKEVIPVVFIMGASSGDASEAMYDSFVDLFWYLTDSDSTDHMLNVYTHKQVQPDKPTACPGSWISARVEDGSILRNRPAPPLPDPTWSQPGDPIDEPEDAHAVFNYLGLGNLSDEMKLAWALDALMRHDTRMTEGGI